MKEDEITTAHIQQAMAQNTLESVDSEMAFRWWCPECDGMNFLTFTHWEVYKNVAECSKCEKGVKVRPPWT